MQYIKGGLPFAAFIVSRISRIVRCVIPRSVAGFNREIFERKGNSRDEYTSVELCVYR